MAVTLTATLAASQPARAVHAGVNSVSGNYDSGSTMVSISGSGMILLCRVPVGATIIDFIENHSSGATSAGISFGIRDQGGSLTATALITAGDKNTQNRGGTNLPYDVGDASSGTSNAYKYVTATIAGPAGSDTTSVQINYTLLYTMDK